MRKMLLLVCLGACTNTSTYPGGSEYEPIVDLHGHNPAVYEQDLTSCRQYARQIDVSKETFAGAAGTAILGTLLGAMMGGLTDGYSWGYGAARGAAYGGFGGAVVSAGSAWKDQASVVKTCLQGRGYNVLR